MSDLPPPQWAADPAGRHAYRWWDGSQWTAHVAGRDRMVMEDPLPLVTSNSAASGVASEMLSRRELAATARQVSTRADAIVAMISFALDAPDSRRTAARGVYERVLERTVVDELAKIPTSRLKETTGGRARLGTIERSGYRTVGQVLGAGEYRLQAIHGVGPETAWRVIGAARQLEAALQDSVRVRFDLVKRPADHVELLAALWRFNVANQNVHHYELEMTQLRADLRALTPDVKRAASQTRLLFSSRRRRQAAAEPVGALLNRLEAENKSRLISEVEALYQTLHQSAPTGDEMWAEFRSSAVLYNGLLIDIAGLDQDEAAGAGYLPAEIAERVNLQPLDLSMLRNLSLRGYQAFGAKFALCQRRVILGDEMGLGKTIEALAAISHLHSTGAAHFLVVSPASVLVNWTHEVDRHSYLTAHRLHGADLWRNLGSWLRNGGIAVTTYQTLQSVHLPMDARDMRVSLLVVDEAHYVKNPNAQRTLAVGSWTRRADRVLFMTGTPMENRVEEFRSLVNQLQPHVASAVHSSDGLAGAARFRQVVAPAYLRRDQADVLDELPQKIETEEWVELGRDDFAAYRNAVASRNFMAMRRAAYAPGTVVGSAKLERLEEIVDEAMSNDRKIVVFSFFLDVIESVMAVLGSRAMGPLTGKVPPIARQVLVDRFTERTGPVVLVSQIEAGGVGQNLQAASVVILTEPQWKPSTEAQAIARCHRMGQSRPVDVHRLLAEDSVDERMLDVIAAKQSLIDAYVPSVVTQVSPDAVDVSDLEMTKEAATQVEAERRIIEIERKRLGLDDDQRQV